MIRQEDGPLRIGVVPTLAWQHAVDRYRHGGAIGGGENDAYLRAAGILFADGTLDPSWEDALGVAATATEGLVMAASMGDAVFLSNVHLGRDRTLVARSRAVAEDGTVVRMEPVVEVILTRTVERWHAFSRVLPPPLTAGPTGTVSAEPVAVADLPPGLTSLEGWDGAPDELRRSAEAALSPDATLAVARGGDPAGSVLWFSRGDDLFRVRDGGLARVPNVADELLGLTEQPGA